MILKSAHGGALFTGALGVLLVLLVHWMSFFWVGTDISLGISQRIYYVHVPSAWVAFMAFGIVALCSIVYLWLKDERADAAAAAAAEGGMVFTTVALMTGSLWGKIAWGTWWRWEGRLILTLLLWFIYLGYFMVRSGTENPDRGRKLSAVVGIIGALTLPINHLSVKWYNGLHPQPVVLKPEAASADGDMVITLLTSLLAFTLVFFGILALRYGLERATNALAVREARGS
jgi:heme exporter protein C